MKLVYLLPIFQLAPTNSISNNELFGAFSRSYDVISFKKVEQDIIQNQNIPYQGKNESIIFFLDQK